MKIALQKHLEEYSLPTLIKFIVTFIFINFMKCDPKQRSNAHNDTNIFSRCSKIC